MEEIKSLTVVDTKVIEDFIFSTGTTLTPQQKRLFIAIAVHNQLDPFKREIHAVPYKDKDGKPTLSIVTGYEVYLKRAERLGKLDGWKVWTEGQGDDLKAVVEIRRKDWSEPLKHEVFFREYNLNRSLWLTKPITMIKKVAIAQGFRLAFPEELAGMPYTADELSETTDIQTDLEHVDVEPEPESQPKLKFEEYMKRMGEIKNIFELKNWWKKHYREMEANLSPEELKELTAYKDHLKEKFDAKEE